MSQSPWTRMGRIVGMTLAAAFGSCATAGTGAPLLQARATDAARASIAVAARLGLPPACLEPCATTALATPSGVEQELVYRLLVEGVPIRGAAVRATLDSNGNLVGTPVELGPTTVATTLQPSSLTEEDAVARAARSIGVDLRDARLSAAEPWAEADGSPTWRVVLDLPQALILAWVSGIDGSLRGSETYPVPVPSQEQASTMAMADAPSVETPETVMGAPDNKAGGYEPNPERQRAAWEAKRDALMSRCGGAAEPLSPHASGMSTAVTESGLAEPGSADARVLSLNNNGREDFEGAFPGNYWLVGDSNASNGASYWDDVSCGVPAEGGWQAWCAAAGRSLCSTYDNFMDAYMAVEGEYYGTTTSGTNRVWFRLKQWLEHPYDSVTIKVEGFTTRPCSPLSGVPAASITFTNPQFDITSYSDPESDRYLSIPASFDSLIYVRITFLFHSDGSVIGSGAYLDNIRFNSQADTSFFPDVGGFNDCCSSPGSFSGLAPTPGQSICTGTNVLFDWGTAAGATYYEFYYDGAPPVVVTQSAHSRAVTAGAHTWDVKAYYDCPSGVDPSTWLSNGPVSFTAAEGLTAPPTLVAPADGATTCGQPTLDWNDVAGAAQYQVWVDGTLRGTASASQFTTSNLGAGAHSWYVLAVSSGPCGNSPASAQRSFTVAAGTSPGVPSAPSPASGAQGVTCPGSFDWADASGATQYDVYVDGQLRGQALTASTFVLSPALSQGSHAWYVVAKNACGQAQGPSWTFNCGAPPQEFTVSMPAGQTVGAGGGTSVVPVRLSAGTNVVAAQFTLTPTPSGCLEIVGIAAGSRLTPAASYTITTNPQAISPTSPATGSVIVLIDSAGTSMPSAEGTLVDVTLRSSTGCSAPTCVTLDLSAAQVVVGLSGQAAATTDGQACIASSCCGGDLNCDHGRDSTDVVLLRRAVVGLQPPSPVPPEADYNADGFVDSTDVVRLRRCITGLEACSPVTCP